jgi:chromosome segregation ATPase
MRECDLNAEKILGKEKAITQELEILKRDKDRIILGQTKLELEKRLKPLEEEIEKIKREMFENTKLKDKSDKNLNDIRMKERGVEDEIKILERRQGETKDEDVLRDIENRRRTIEETRRQMEKDRWDVEDKMSDLEEKRKLIKEKYQEVAAQAKQIKAELMEIEEKIK